MYILFRQLLSTIIIGMERIFKPKLYRIMLNGFYGICAAIFVTVLVGYISDNVVYALIAGIVVLILYIWLVVINTLITIKLDTTHLIVKKGKEERYFELAQCNFRAKTITRS